MDNVHDVLTNTAKLRFDLDKKAHVRVSPDQYNYRSPKKYVSLYLNRFVTRSSIQHIHLLYSKLNCSYLILDTNLYIREGSANE